MTESDPRRMLYLEGGLSGTCYELKIEGITIPPSPWYGGATARQGYYAYYFEDTARNDADGPPADIQ